MKKNLNKNLIIRTKKKQKFNLNKLKTKKLIRNHMSITNFPKKIEKFTKKIKLPLLNISNLLPIFYKIPKQSRRQLFRILKKFKNNSFVYRTQRKKKIHFILASILWKHSYFYKNFFFYTLRFLKNNLWKFSIQKNMHNIKNNIGFEVWKKFYSKRFKKLNVFKKSRYSFYFLQKKSKLFKSYSKCLVKKEFIFYFLKKNLFLKNEFLVNWTKYVFFYFNKRKNVTKSHLKFLVNSRCINKSWSLEIWQNLKIYKNFLERCLFFVCNKNYSHTKKKKLKKFFFSRNNKLLNKLNLFIFLKKFLNFKNKKQSNFQGFLNCFDFIAYSARFGSKMFEIVYLYLKKNSFLSQILNIRFKFFRFLFRYKHLLKLAIFKRGKKKFYFFNVYRLIKFTQFCITNNAFNLNSVISQNCIEPLHFLQTFLVIQKKQQKKNLYGSWKIFDFMYVLLSNTDLFLYRKNNIFFFRKIFLEKIKTAWWKTQFFSVKKNMNKEIIKFLLVNEKWKKIQTLNSSKQKFQYKNFRFFDNNVHYLRFLKNLEALNFWKLKKKIYIKGFNGALKPLFCDMHLCIDLIKNYQIFNNISWNFYISQHIRGRKFTNIKKQRFEWQYRSNFLIIKKKFINSIVSKNIKIIKRINCNSETKYIRNGININNFLINLKKTKKKLFFFYKASKFIKKFKTYLNHKVKMLNFFYIYKTKIKCLNNKKDIKMFFFWIVALNKKLYVNKTNKKNAILFFKKKSKKKAKIKIRNNILFLNKKKIKKLLKQKRKIWFRFNRKINNILFYEITKREKKKNLFLLFSFGKKIKKKENDEKNKTFILINLHKYIFFYAFFSNFLINTGKILQDIFKYKNLFEVFQSSSKGMHLNIFLFKLCKIFWKKKSLNFFIKVNLIVNWSLNSFFLHKKVKLFGFLRFFLAYKNFKLEIFLMLLKKELQKLEKEKKIILNFVKNSLVFSVKMHLYKNILFNKKLKQIRNLKFLYFKVKYIKCQLCN